MSNSWPLSKWAVTIPSSPMLMWVKAPNCAPLKMFVNSPTTWLTPLAVLDGLAADEQPNPIVMVRLGGLGLAGLLEA